METNKLIVKLKREADERKDMQKRYDELNGLLKQMAEHLKVDQADKKVENSLWNKLWTVVIFLVQVFNLFMSCVYLHDNWGRNSYFGHKPIEVRDS